jgi:DNA invertase Pin-like site-specific DNA recombinase
MVVGAGIFDAMLVGYARVSTAGQSADHQVDALLRAGVARENIHVDVASGAKASRPEWDVVQHKVLRAGDTLVITRLDRLSRSVLHLITLGAELREREIELRVLEQGIDTSTVEGRAMFGMLSVLAELQRELILANTRDGLAAARARGRVGGRRPRLTPEQAALAQQLYDARDKSVQAIADLFGVPRSTVYGHLTRTTATAPPAAEASTTADGEASTTGVPAAGRHPAAPARPGQDYQGDGRGVPPARRPAAARSAPRRPAAAVPTPPRAAAETAGATGRVVDLSAELGAPAGAWQLVETEPGSWQLRHDGARVGVVRREATSRGRCGWLARLDTGVPLPAHGDLAAAPGSNLWRTRDLAAAAIAHQPATAGRGRRRS